MAWTRLFRFRYSLAQLLIAVALVAIGIVSWQGYQYFSAPYLEGDVERAVLQIDPKDPSMSAQNRIARGIIPMLDGPIGPVGIGVPGQTYWFDKAGSALEFKDTSIAGLAWRLADRRPITGVAIYWGDYTNQGHDFFSNVTQLTHFHFFGRNARITPAQLQALLSNKSLKGLTLANIPLTKEETLLIAQNSRLEQLFLSQNGLSEKDLLPLRSLTNLKYLGLAHNFVTDRTVEALVIQMPSLMSLNLTACPISDKSLEAVGKLSGLIQFDAENTSITDQGVRSLRRCALITLNLVDTKITSASLKMLAEVKSLRCLLVPKNGTWVGCEHLEYKRPDILLVTF